MKKFKKKGEVLNLDLYQCYMAFVQEVLSRSIQYFRNEGQLHEQDSAEVLASIDFQFADYLNDTLDFLLTYKNFKEWLDKR